ncbi:MAG TPA: DnaJ domain-containing protein [Roseateles sp.]|uniref:J domain-containing protein n=1 Tax=Roseateles sp. TaxID=1971397 RepID=UPI002ED8774C
MTPDYYEVLGVSRDATPDQVKAAFRRARSAAHPDRHGGSEEAMKLVNLAHDCLTDPERRAIYDATGVDQPSGDQVKELTEQLLDKQASDSLRMLLAQLIEELDGWELLDTARKLTADQITKLQRSIGQAKGRVQKLTAKLGRVRVKSGTNLVEEVMQAAIDKANTQVENDEATLRIVQRCQQLLGDYDADKPLPRSPLAGAQQKAYGDPMHARFQQFFGDRGSF